MMRTLILIAAFFMICGNATAEELDNDSNYYIKSSQIEENKPVLFDYKINDKQSFNVTANVKNDYDLSQPQETQVIAKFKFTF